MWPLYMTSTYLFHFSKIICLNTFLKFHSFIHMTSKLNILLNHIEHLKGLAPCYTIPPFTILKSPYLISQTARLEKMTSVWGIGRLVWRDWASKTPTSFSSHRSDHENQDHEDPLKLNKAPAGPYIAPAEPLQALPPEIPEIDIA